LINDDREFSRLQWQCRRGSRELDLLLDNYLRKHYPSASLVEQAHFVSLLTLEDDELMKVMMAWRK
jgi:antitoxin CptB